MPTTTYQYGCQVQVYIGVPTQPAGPHIIWSSMIFPDQVTANKMLGQFEELVKAIQAGFQERQLRLGQPYPDMPGLGFFITYTPITTP
jgi:hypothetical protein